MTNDHFHPQGHPGDIHIAFCNGTLCMVWGSRRAEGDLASVQASVNIYRALHLFSTDFIGVTIFKDMFLKTKG